MRFVFTASEAAELTGINYKILLRDIHKGRLRVARRKTKKYNFEIRAKDLVIYHAERVRIHNSQMAIDTDEARVDDRISAEIMRRACRAYPLIFGSLATDNQQTKGA